MKRALVAIAMCSILSLGTTATIQCPGNGGPVLDFITIEVINDTPAPLATDFLISSDPLITQDELLDFGEPVLLDADAGDIVSVDIDCVDAAALILDIAELLVEDGGIIGTNILYLDEDYFCGEIISFEFTASNDLTELFVDVAFFTE